LGSRYQKISFSLIYSGNTSTPLGQVTVSFGDLLLVLQPEVCVLCKKTVKDLKKHQRRGNCLKPQEERKVYPCHSCEKSFTQKHHLVRHVDNIHLKTRDVLCAHCAYKTTNNFNLKIHVR
jgi:DNA-directed RNA polymerase subunit RPC12/RpoP